MNNNKSTFALRLRELREQRGICRRTLGERLGLSKNIIGKYEKGERTPSLAVLISLSDFFDVSVDYLVGRK